MLHEKINKKKYLNGVINHDYIPKKVSTSLT